MLTEKSIGQSLIDGRQKLPVSSQWRPGRLRRHPFMLGFIIVVFAVFAVIVALMIPPTFLATSRLMYDPRPENIATAPQVLADSPADAMAVDTQVEILKSNATAQKVVALLNLANDPEFNTVAPRGILARLFRRDVSSNSKERITNEAVAENLARHLIVRNLGLSSVIEVGFRSISPEKAARIANAVASVYVSDQLEIKRQATEKAISSLSARLTELRENAERSEEAVKIYQGTSGLVGLKSATGATALEQQIQALTTELATAHAQEADADAKLKTIKSIDTTSDTFADSLSSPVIQALKRQRNEASARIAELSSTYGSLHPSVLSEKKQLSDIDTAITTEILRIRGSIESDARTAKERTSAISAALQAATHALQQANVASVGASQLENQAEADRLVYQSFLDRYKQISAQTGMERPEARIISVAYPPTHPSTPIRRLIVLSGVLVGCVFALVFVTWYEAVFGGVYNDEEISSLFDLPCLGSIPELESTLNKGAAANDTPINYPTNQRASVFSEMLRGIAASSALKSKKHVAVLITSSVEHEGKSTTTITLGRTLALNGVRTLLIDCDLTRRSSTVALNGTSSGICELVKGTHSLDEVINIDPASGMHWIGVSETSGANAAGTFAHPSISQLLGRLRTQYELVLLDAAPILASADTQNLARRANQIILTIRWARTRRSVVAAAVKLIAILGANITGVILTRVDVRQQSRMGEGSKYAHYKRYLTYSR